MVSRQQEVTKVFSKTCLIAFCFFTQTEGQIVTGNPFDKRTVQVSNFCSSLTFNESRFAIHLTDHI